MTKRTYEEFPSSNKFFCQGVLLSGPDRGQFRGALVLIATFSVLYFAFVLPYLVARIFGIPILLFSLLLLAHLLASFLVCAYTDPGIIPREHEPEPDNGSNKENYEVQVKNKKYEVKFCVTCQIHKPPRAIHCGICDNCVERFDHHCPWTGNCVGRNNYKYFLTFVSLVVFAELFAFCMCLLMVLLSIADQERDFGLSVFGLFVSALISPPPENIIVAVLLGTALLIVVWPTAFLLAFHLNLIRRGINTNEYIKKLYPETTSPYNRGFFGNFLFLCCAPQYPRYFRMRNKVPNDYDHVRV